MDLNFPYLRDFNQPGSEVANVSYSPDVVGDAGIEQHAVLGHDTDCSPQALLGHVADILTVNENPAFALLEVVLPEQKSKNRALPTTTLADEGRRLSFPNGETDVVQRRGLPVVRERDVFWATK